MEFLKLYDEENRDILFSMSWLNKNSIFDKSVGSFEDIDLFTFLENINSFDYEKDIFYDDVYYILEYTEDSIFHLINNINKEIKREHKIVPISQAKEFDKKTILWLSRQDGRTLKEKLKNNKIKAVKRYKNVDTYENRIFKIFLKKLVLIEEKREQIQSNAYLISKIRQWLRSDDAKSINEYGNIVYNNILLHHPHYSKIFKSYKWLNRLDEKVEFYSTTYNKQLQIIIKFEVLYQLQFYTEVPILAKNLNIDRAKYSIDLKNPIIGHNLDKLLESTHKKFLQKINKNNFFGLRQFIESELKSVITSSKTFKIDIKETNQIFIDLFRLFPIAKLNTEIINLPITLLQNIDGTIVNANNTKVIDLNHEIYTLPEILKTYDTNILRVFLENFEKYFKEKQLNYIIPDYVNIFEFSFVKKTINSYFPNSRNIPKSILAGLQYLFDGTLQKSDTLIYIQKNHDNDLYVTPLLVKYDESLQSITHGLYLEKHPTRKLKEESDIVSELNRYFNDSGLSKKLLNKFLQNGIKGIKKEQIAFYHDNNLVYLKNTKNLSKLQNRTEQIKSLFTNRNLFKKDFIEIKDTNEDNLNNFEKLLQYEKNNYKLWKEHLPRLAMGNMPMNGYFGEFVLVNDDSEVINGMIEIKNHFSIPANTTELSFPLIFGEENINFEAYITSNQLPFKEDVACELELRYNYEDETPYKLTFIPLDKKYKPLNVKWREIQYKECKNLPIPSYPPKKSWQELEKFKNKDNSETNLLDWISKDFKRIIEINQMLKDDFFQRTLAKEWLYDKNNKEYQDFSTEYGNIRIYKNKYLEEATEIKFKIEKKGRFYNATNILSDKEHIRFIKSMRFPLYTIWKDGNSSNDKDVPNDFMNLVNETIKASINLLESQEINNNLKKELFLFLSIINKDAPNSIINTHVEFFKDDFKIKEFKEVIPYSVGCLENENQFKLLNTIINLLKDLEEKKYSNALKILGIMLWRCEEVLFDIDINNINLIINKLLNSLKIKVSSKKELIKNNKIKPSVINRLELLLAILRYRKKELVLKPEENITIEYIKIVDQISKKVVENKLIFNSRIQLNIKKIPDFKNTPDLLYALRMYLSGNIEATQSIKVLGVSDD